MSNKIEHKITWEINTVKTKPENWYNKLLKWAGHTETEVHTYILDLEIATNDGDSADSALDSIIRQLKNISTSDEHKITAHNGIRKTQFIRNDLL